MSKDVLFERKAPVGDFAFDKNVTNVFDDMLSRSIPMYDEIQRMMIELSVNYIQPRTNVYDLGCSTGTTLIMLDDCLKKAKRNQNQVKLMGMDSSPSMLAKTRERFQRHNIKNYTLHQHDLNDEFKFENASCIFMNWTLQFVRPINRLKLMRSIFKGLNKEGIFIMAEKVVVKNSMLNRSYIDLYYNFKKRQGYSELEISKKREALENVLVPYRVEENYELLNSAGFSTVDIFFKWYNFCGFIALKD